jgi:hypothetical protein
VLQKKASLYQTRHQLLEQVQRRTLGKALVLVPVWALGKVHLLALLAVEEKALVVKNNSKATD